MIHTRSAGGVVVGNSGQVIVVNQKHKSWSLPKGHIDPGETPLDAAIREIREESGITQLEMIKELGSYTRHLISKDGKGEDKSESKTLSFFLFKTTQEELSPEDPENPEAIWVQPEKVTALLTHQKDKAFFHSVMNDVKQLLPE